MFLCSSCLSPLCPLSEEAHQPIMSFENSVTNCHKLNDLKHRNLFPYNSRGQKSDIEVLQEPLFLSVSGKDFSLSLPAPRGCQNFLDSSACDYITAISAPLLHITSSICQVSWVSLIRTLVSGHNSGWSLHLKITSAIAIFPNRVTSIYSEN